MSWRRLEPDEAIEPGDVWHCLFDPDTGEFGGFELVDTAGPVRESWVGRTVRQVEPRGGTLRAMSEFRVARWKGQGPPQPGPTGAGYLGHQAAAELAVGRMPDGPGEGGAA